MPLLRLQIALKYLLRLEHPISTSEQQASNCRITRTPYLKIDLQIQRIFSWQDRVLNLAQEKL